MTLKLIETFIEKSEDPAIVLQNFIPPLFEAALVEYNNNIPDARDPEVLSVLAVIIDKLKGAITNEIPRIFGSVFECTLQMITKNFEDYPEHRLHFFTLLRAINSQCFQALFMISSTHFKLVIDSIVWAFKHTERQISETGLNILFELLKNISKANPDISAMFYKTYFLSLLQDVFYVLTDTFHKSGFKLQATILLHMFTAVESGTVNTPLWDLNLVTEPTTNQQFVRQYVIKLLNGAFPHISIHSVTNFVLGLFDPTKDLATFKNHLRDFLVQLKEFSSGDNEELFLEEREAAMAAIREAEIKKAMSIPGMVPPNERPDEMND